MFFFHFFFCGFHLKSVFNLLQRISCSRHRLHHHRCLQYILRFLFISWISLRVIVVKDFELFKKVFTSSSSSHRNKFQHDRESLKIKWLNESEVCSSMSVFVGKGQTSIFCSKNKLLDHELDWLSKKIIHLKSERNAES